VLVLAALAGKTIIFKLYLHMKKWLKQKQIKIKAKFISKPPDSGSVSGSLFS